MKSNFLTKFLLYGALAVAATGCGPEGLINKTKYNGKKVTNTCETFQSEVKSLLEANTGPNKLRTSEYDNSQFDYFFLEPGQFEIKGDTVYFRLIGDLEYGKYLTKGTAIHVSGKANSLEHLKNMEEEPSSDLGMMVIDENYWKNNQVPYFGYKLPVGTKLDGKQITLSFSVVQYKKGKIKKVFCNTVEVPLGPLDGSCCTDKPWEEVKPSSIVAMPDLNIPDEQYRYKGFTGTLDLIFPMSSAKFNQKELTEVIVNYIEKYEKEGFKVTSIGIDGYASQGGKEDYNQRLSGHRSKAVEDDLNAYYQKKNETLPIISNGKGEDWERFELLTKTASFDDNERQQILAISSSGKSSDEKEAELRKLPFWNKLVKEVLESCRHTLVSFTFDWTPDKMYTDYYTTSMPVISPQLYDVSTKKMTIGKYVKGAEANKGLTVLNKLIPNNEKANLFAMRSTYYFGLNDVQSAIKDIEKAQSLDANNKEFGIAALAFKTKYAYSYSLDDRLKMLDAYNDFVTKSPNDKNLLLNRAVMMEKVGFISGALKEFNKLVGENSNQAAALNNRGVARMKTNRITEAEADFKEAISLDENMAEPHFNLACVYAYKGLTDKCVAELDRAIALEANYKTEIFANPVFNIMKDNPKFSKYR